MANKKRYLQISDIMMFEMDMLGEGADYENLEPISFIYTKQVDGRYLILSPISYECEKDVESDSYKKIRKPVSINTLNHLSVPKDVNLSEWYSFLDPDYEYIDDSIMNSIDPDQIKAREYAKYLSDPMGENSSNPYCRYYYKVPDIRFDSMRLYFVNGYDFSNVYGIMMRLCADGNDQKDAQGGVIEREIDLCNFFLNKSTFFKLVEFLPTPIIFGNNIYDRYIEVKVPCLYDLMRVNDSSSAVSQFIQDVNIKDWTMLNLNFAYIFDDDKEINRIDYSISELANPNVVTNDMVNLNFTRSSVLNGSLPTSFLNSDNLGAYISECTDVPYLMFYATWMDNPLTSEIVWQFNKTIRLYDTSLIRDHYDYEIDDDYKVEYDMKKWICLHEIKTSFCMGDHVAKEETYSMTQIFVNETDPHIFYYRPTIFDQELGMYINNVQIVYTMRFINSHDKVQFVKVATLSLYDDLQKYYAKGTTLKMNQLKPYKIFNKIIENKHEFVGNGNQLQRTKYVKMFYNSTDIVLDDHGDPVQGNYSYVLSMSSAPKSYKFTFKKTGTNGTYTYLDLSNGYYKLMFKGSDGIDVVIEPTYTQNMNLYVGELEFNISSVMITKLMGVQDTDRKMSIVVQNEDGSVSSMFDFMYEI